MFIVYKSLIEIRVVNETMYVICMYVITEKSWIILANSYYAYKVK